ncbi:E3 ubiquitin-protein ligase MBR2-like isoform X1 [Tripterygium wilfordii]|uniref:E3 ubiquitin-protein ligase MBR2-like isoform X1 n=1 Tax=Tripterygium wilfordii TaxID=458696 RepID=UPI0018F84395|nr:E3 ubiquitin-protein ligase MBR2-like isoform X1 [Tripterygium wilfordii]XP_038696419.1 E3 ubiquitin-protein ligase MBR2-like isoform X1 [Tripterygium wilfordii]
MDEYSGKRAVDGVVISRKGSAVALRDTASSRDRNAQFCSRIGCSGRPNSLKGTQVIGSEKGKSSRPSFRFSSNGKEILGSTSRAFSATNTSKKSLTETRKRLTTQLETDSSESSSVQDEPEIPDSRSPLEKTQRELQPGSESAESSEVTSVELGSSSVSSNTRSRKNFRQRLGLANPDSPLGPSVSSAPRSTSNNARANASRYGMKNFKCSSIADVIPSNCSSSESNASRKKDPLKKRNCEGESSSSARGKKMTGSSAEGQNSIPSHGISISDSRQARNFPANRDNGIPSVRNRRSFNGYTRTRVASQENRNCSSQNEFPLVPQQMPQSDITIDFNDPSSSHQFSLETFSSLSSSYGRLGNSSEYMRGIRPASPAEGGSSRSLINRESFRRYNMDGIAEQVLLALERIEQDEELTYEQLLVLETSLFLNGLNFYDQHREMRLDIDNMSYEELLALEERMGSVSTALTEEALSTCLKTSIYQSTTIEDAITVCAGEKSNVKCSICQEEYIVGDEVGRLRCEHRYHATCIQQWLRLKNWCPICKAAAVPSPSASTPP